MKINYFKILNLLSSFQVIDHIEMQTVSQINNIYLYTTQLLISAVST